MDESAYYFPRKINILLLNALQYKIAYAVKSQSLIRLNQGDETPNG